MAPAERIAFVTPRYADGGIVGGAETLIRNQASAAQRAGRRVSILTTCAVNHFTWENTHEPGTRTVDDMEVSFFPTDRRDMTSFMLAQRAVEKKIGRTEEDELTWLRQGVSSDALYAYLREEGQIYDRIMIGPYLFGLTYFAAQIHPDRTVLIPCLHDECFAYMGVMRKMFRAVRTCMFNSPAEQALGLRLYDLDAANCAVVGTGLEPPAFDATVFKRNHSEVGDYIVYSGRREHLKGTPLLVDYFKTFRERTGRDLHLVMTGTGEIQVHPELRPYVHDLGYVSEQEKYEAMAGAIAFCHPSRFESFGIVLMESWLTGTPALVHADSDVMRDHCKTANGGLWWQTYPEFEEQLSFLMDHPEVRERMGRTGREYVNTHYTWDAITERLLAAIDR